MEMENATKISIDENLLAQILGTSAQQIATGGEPATNYVVQVGAMPGVGGTENLQTEENFILIGTSGGGMSKSDAMIIEVNLASDRVFDTNPENIHVRAVAGENFNDVRTVVCDVYAGCDEHQTDIMTRDWPVLQQSRNEGHVQKLSTFEMVENVGTSRGLATVETHVVNDFKVVPDTTDTTCREQVMASQESIMTSSQEPANQEREEESAVVSAQLAEMVAENDSEIPVTVAMQSLDRPAVADAADARIESNCVRMDEESPTIIAEEPYIVSDKEMSDEDSESGLKEVHVAVELQPTEEEEIENLMKNNAMGVMIFTDTFGCSECPDFKSGEIYIVKEHVKGHENGRMTYICSVCGKKFYNQGNLSRHRDTHRNYKPFPCEYCGKRFGQKTHMQRHLDEQKANSRCGHCPFTSKYRCAMTKHSREQHPDQLQVKPKPIGTTVWQCGVCDYECMSKRDLAQHMKHHTSKTPLNYKCEACSFVTDYPCRLKRHVLSHTQERPFRCGVCDYKGSQVEHVIRHVRTQHRAEPKYSLASNQEPKITTILPACQNVNELRKTGLLSDLPSGADRNRDLETHKMFSCTLCNLGFQRPRNLQKHLDDMHGEEHDRYICSVCQYRAPSATGFIEHLARHKAPPPPVEYMCSYCHFKADKRRNFVYHMQARHSKIVHFGPRNATYGVSDFNPEFLQGHLPQSDIHEFVGLNMFETIQDTNTNEEIFVEESSEVEKKDDEDIVRVNEGDLIQINDVIYRIESSGQENTNLFTAENS